MCLQRRGDVIGNLPSVHLERPFRTSYGLAPDTRKIDLIFAENPPPTRKKLPPAKRNAFSNSLQGRERFRSFPIKNSFSSTRTTIFAARDIVFYGRSITHFYTFFHVSRHWEKVFN